MNTKDVYEAVKRGDIESLCKIIEQNPSLKEKTYNDWTPLELAAYYGRVGIVQYLVCEEEADMDKGNWDGYTPLLWAAEGGHLGVVRYLAGQARADKDKADVFGWTPLMVAAYNGHLDVVRYLLEEGADDKLKSKYGKTALTYAEGEDRAEVAVLLREYLPGGLVYQRRNAVEEVILDAGLGPDVAQFCGDFVFRRTLRV